MTDNGKAVAFGTDSDNNDISWKGVFDGLRIRKGSFDENYIAAEYKAMNAGGTDIFTYGPATSVVPVTPHGEWDVPAAKGGIRAKSDGKGGKFITVRSVSVKDGRIVVDFEAGKVDADGQVFGLICKEKLTDAKTFTINVTLKNGVDTSLGSLEGLTSRPQLFILGIETK